MNIAKKKKLIFEGERFLGSLLGTFIYAIGINMFVVPTALYSSGLLGVCQVIRTLLVDYLHLPFDRFDIVGVIYWLINIPILLFAIKSMGKGFLLRTLGAVTAMTVFLAFIPIRPIVEDTLTACVVPLYPVFCLLRRRFFCLCEWRRVAYSPFLLGNINE